MKLLTPSLRLRLFLAFLTVALVLAALSALAVRNSWRIRRQVMELTSISIARFESSRSLGQALEIEGDWLASGVMDATDIQVLAEPRRPKLRGAIQRVEPDAGRLWMYGVPIAVGESTEFLDPGGTLAALAAGERVEVSCSVDTSGNWSARKIRHESLKSSDKIKGVVTAVSMNGVAPDTLEISGIPVLLDVEGRAPDPRVELKRITMATRMSLALQDCDVAARALAGARELPTGAADRGLVSPPALLAESLEVLAESVARARTGLAAGDQAGGHGLRVDSALWLEPLLAGIAELDSLAGALGAAAAADPAAAAGLYAERFEPLIYGRLRPLVEAYLLDAEERLALEVEQVSEQARATSRALLAASALALVVSLGLGYGVWRSIARPLTALRQAAEQLGRGNLTARAPVGASDELGLLAATFNRMADDLALTTVSIANLDDVLESMAGALFVLDGEGRIASANRAAGILLGGSAAELAGRDFRAVCEDFSLQPGEGGPFAGERTLRRLDGDTVTVSFSGAPLGRAGGGQGLVCIALDLTARKQLEDRLRGSLAEKELLLREIHHRVKNNLQIISSLLDLQSDRIADPVARALYADSQARIRSMALIHQQLYGADALDRIDFGAYLEQLAASLFHFGGGGHARIRVEAQPARLGIDQALTCGLIVNELVINALKHAFPEGRAGNIRLAFSSDGAHHVLRVADDGVGLPPGAWNPDRGTLGTSLVTSLVEQLAGRLEVAAAPGATFTITFPATEATA